MANKTIYPFGISGEQSEGIWSERITEMQAKIDMLAPWAYRDEPSTPIYSIESSVTTQNYDTGVKLFDEPKSFTILCVATFNNYSWSSVDSVQSILGISTDNYFRVGKIYQGVNYNNGASTGTDNFYFAVIMNNTSGGKMCVSIAGRVDGTRTVRFAITYDHTTRKIRGQTSQNTEKKYWYTVSGDLTSEDTLKLLIGNATGTISQLDIYDKVLDWMTIDNLLLDY